MKLSSVTLVLNMNKAGPSDHANQMQWQFAEVQPYFQFYSCNWDQMGLTVSADPRRDSVETSISSPDSDTISFSTFCISVESLLTQWPMMMS